MRLRSISTPYLSGTLPLTFTNLGALKELCVLSLQHISFRRLLTHHAATFLTHRLLVVSACYLALRALRRSAFATISYPVHWTRSAPLHASSECACVSHMSLPFVFHNSCRSLNGNQFNGSFPSAFGALSLLTFLGVNMNQLSGSIPTSIGNMAALLGLCVARACPGLPDPLTGMPMQINSLDRFQRQSDSSQA